jgi:hypothetical protein
MREEQNRYDITLKCRHPDRYISASYDLSHPADYHRLKFKGFKFEEDITTPFYSKFSSQAKFGDHKKPELKTFQDIVSDPIQFKESQRKSWDIVSEGVAKMVEDF